MEALQNAVRKHGVVALPGNTLQPSVLTPLLQKAVRGGFISPEAYGRVSDALRFGFRLSVDFQKILASGKRYYRNYPSALAGRDAVCDAIRARVDAGRTLILGTFERRELEDLPVASASIFPLLAIPKPHEPGVWRPLGDHTKSQLNTFSRPGKFSLKVLEWIVRKLSRGMYMRVTDIDGAFTLMGLHPDLWPFFLFLWFDVRLPRAEQHRQNILYVHVFSDFGSAGAPEEWGILFDTILDLARMEEVLTLPLKVYVDDLTHLGPDGLLLEAEGERLDAFLETVGTSTKTRKTKHAAQFQLSLGLWWHSILFTLQLDELKRNIYLTEFAAASAARVVTLRQMQRLAGTGQRAALTMMPGSKVLLASTWSLMSGLRLAHHKRRTTARFRGDWEQLRAQLEENAGRGYYRFDDFLPGGEAFTDASKQKRFAGGGYCHSSGCYRFWYYGAARKRHFIDALEGDAVLVFAEDMGPTLSGCIVVVHVDNSAFQQSAVKGWSHADRLNHVLRLLLACSVKHNFIMIFEWISTDLNVLADALSRDNEIKFCVEAVAHGSPIVGPLQRHPDSGNRRDG